MKGFEVLTLLCGFVSLVAADGGRISVPGYQKNLCNGVDTEGSFFAAQGNCNNYIICYNGNPLEMSCGGYHFNPKKLVCEDPKTAGCTHGFPLVEEKPEASPCFAVADGIKLPVPGNSKQYYFCLKNKALLKDCGNYNFDFRLKACSSPATNVPLISPTTISPDTSSPCYGLSNGFKIPVPGDSRQYYLCMNNKHYLKDCGIYEFHGKECAGPLVTKEPLIYGTTTKPIIKHDQPKPSPSSSPCYGLSNGFKIPVPGDSRQYYLCMNNKHYLKDCGIYEFHGKECAGPLVTKEPLIYGTTTKPIIKHDQPKPSPSSSPCYGLSNGFKIPVPGDSRQYYLCMNNKHYLKDCGIYEFHGKECAGPLVTKEPFIYGTTSKPIIQHDQPKQFEELVKKHCSNKSFGSRIPIPGFCSLYIICTRSTGFVKNCGWRHFNEKTASCDLPQNVKCKHGVDTQSSGNEVTQKPNAIVSTQLENAFSKRICQNKEDGTFFAAPLQCSKFYVCLKQKGYLKSCGENYHFDTKLSTCVRKADSRCVEAKVSTIISHRAADNINIMCVGRSSGTLLQHPSNCGMFIICDNQVPQEMSCPDGLHFNPNENKCDWIENYHCNL